MDAPKQLTAEELEACVEDVRTIVSESNIIRRPQYVDAIVGGDSGITHGDVHRMFMDVTEHRSLSALAMLTPAMIGPTERRFFSDIAAVGLATLQMVDGVPPGNRSPEAIDRRLRKVFADRPALMAHYNRLNRIVSSLSEHFPPTPFEQVSQPLAR